MSDNSPELVNSSNQPTLSFEWQIVKKDGPKLSENFSPCLLLVKYPNGTFRKFGLQENDSKLLEEGLQDPSLWSTFLTSVFGYLKVQPEDDLPVLNVTT